MTFNLFGIDFYRKDELFGFWLGAIKYEEERRCLFGIYWKEGNLLIDLFWFHIVDTYPIDKILGL